MGQGAWFLVLKISDTTQLLYSWKYVNCFFPSLSPAITCESTSSLVCISSLFGWLWRCSWTTPGWAKVPQTWSAPTLTGYLVLLDRVFPLAIPWYAKKWTWDSRHTNYGSCACCWTTALGRCHLEVTFICCNTSIMLNYSSCTLTPLVLWKFSGRLPVPNTLKFPLLCFMPLLSCSTKSSFSLPY